MNCRIAKAFVLAESPNNEALPRDSAQFGQPWLLRLTAGQGKRLAAIKVAATLPLRPASRRWNQVRSARAAFPAQGRRKILKAGELGREAQAGEVREVRTICREGEGGEGDGVLGDVSLPGPGPPANNQRTVTGDLCRAGRARNSTAQLPRDGNEPLRTPTRD
jgi:hypothetical protein